MEKRYKIIEIPKFYCKNQEVHITEYHDGYSDCHILCKINNEACDEEHCNHKQLQLEGFTKEEMIDKMARAIYSEMEKETKTIKNKYTLNSNKFAEAALNALLGDK